MSIVMAEELARLMREEHMAAAARYRATRPARTTNKRMANDQQREG